MIPQSSFNLYIGTRRRSGVEFLWEKTEIMNTWNGITCEIKLAKATNRSIPHEREDVHVAE